MGALLQSGVELEVLKCIKLNVFSAYDNIGQLKTAIGRESGGTARLNEQFGYA